MKKKKMLILSCSGVMGEDEECMAICQQAELYELDVVRRVISCEDDIRSIISTVEPCKYIYLSAHGNADGFGDNKSIDMSWSSFAEILCDSNCLSEDTVIMLSCCYGGLALVADTLFRSCDNLSYVIGPRQSLEPPQMHISFGIFLFNVEYRSIDPIVACEKIKLATDIRFSCYDVEEWKNDEIIRSINH